MNDTTTPPGSRQVAAAWWLDTARAASRTITDAPRPDSVHSTNGGHIVLAGSARPGRPRQLLVPREQLTALADTDEGTWWAAHAVAAGRWPRRRGNIPALAILLGVIGISIIFTASAGSIPFAAGLIAGTVCTALAAAIIVNNRRMAVTIAQTSDIQATRIAGIDAARSALTGMQPHSIYKTALHQWIADHDALQPRNRLARLECTHDVPDQA